MTITFKVLIFAQCTKYINVFLIILKILVYRFQLRFPDWFRVLRSQWLNSCSKLIVRYIVMPFSDLIWHLMPASLSINKFELADDRYNSLGGWHNRVSGGSSLSPTSAVRWSRVWAWDMSSEIGHVTVCVGQNGWPREREWSVPVVSSQTSHCCHYWRLRNTAALLLLYTNTNIWSFEPDFSIKYIHKWICPLTDLLLH